MIEHLNPFGRTPEEEFARKREMENCPTCQQPGLKPPHFASKSCRSNGRRFSIEDHDFKGYIHCSCDSCF